MNYIKICVTVLALQSSTPNVFSMLSSRDEYDLYIYQKIEISYGRPKPGIKNQTHEKTNVLTQILTQEELDAVTREMKETLKYRRKFGKIQEVPLPPPSPSEACSQDGEERECFTQEQSDLILDHDLSDDQIFEQCSFLCRLSRLSNELYCYCFCRQKKEY